MNEKRRNLLGLARKAGKLASGSAQVEALIKKKKGYLLIIAEDAPGMTKKFEKWANDIALPVLVSGSKEELGNLTGNAERAVILVLDRGLAQAIQQAEV